eukprot:Gb_39902 [translate_table: standard]
MGFLLQTAPSIAYSPKVPAFITSTISHSAATAFSFSGNVGFSHVCSCSCTGRGAPELGSSSKRGSSLIIARATIGDDEESRFLDEDGSVKDMDGYLNHLSLEYDSVWDTKPACSQIFYPQLPKAVVAAAPELHLYEHYVTCWNSSLSGVVLSDMGIILKLKQMEKANLKHHQITPNTNKLCKAINSSMLNEAMVIEMVSVHDVFVTMSEVSLLLVDGSFQGSRLESLTVARTRTTCGCRMVEPYVLLRLSPIEPHLRGVGVHVELIITFVTAQETIHLPATVKFLVAIWHLNVKMNVASVHVIMLAGVADLATYHLPIAGVMSWTAP